MCKAFKKIFTLFLTICIMLSSVFCGLTVSATEDTSDIESISVVATASPIENTNGYYTTGWDSQSGTNKQYFSYSTSAFAPELTVNYKDGTSATYKYNDISNQTGYWLSIEQSYENKFTVGENTVTATFRGLSCEFTVTIRETPVEYITVVATHSPVEYTEGYYNYGWNSQTHENAKYYYYPSESFSPTVTVNYKDGSTETYSYYELDGRNEFGLQIYQDYENRFTVGENTVVATFMGVSCTFTVTILENNIESFSVEATKTLIEGENGYYNSGFDSETQTYKQYFCYNLSAFEPKLTVNYKNGDTVTYNYSEDPYIFESELIILQDYSSRLKIGSNTATAYFHGKSCEFNVIVATNSIDESGEFEYLLQSDKAYITDYRGTENILYIPSNIDGYSVAGVLKISENTGITTVIIPNSIRFLSEKMFINLPNIETLTIGSDVAELENSWFRNCTKLEKITVSSKNSYLCDVDGVVYNKDKTVLTVYPLGKKGTYNVPSSVENIDVILTESSTKIDLVFSEDSPYFVTENFVTYTPDKKQIVYCSPNISGDYVMPDTVEEIPSMAFYGCDKITSVKVSNKVTDITYFSFYGCTSLAYVEIPNSVKTIGMSAFSNTGLTSLNVPNSVVQIGASSFSNSPIKTLSLGNSLKTIGSFAFAYCDIQKLTLPQKLNEIGVSAFVENDFKEVAIPDSVTGVGDEAFRNCSLLETATLSKNMHYVQRFTFKDCVKLKNVTIPEGVISIGVRVFDGCIELKTLTIPDSVRSLGTCVFRGSGISEFDFNKTLTHTGEFTFAGSKNLTDINLPPNITDISYASFYNCTSLSSISIPDTVTTVRAHSFDGVAIFNSVENGPIYIDNVFYKYKGDYPANTPLSIKEGTTIIADCAFENGPSNTSSNTDFELEDNGNYPPIYNCIYNTDNLKEVILPDTLKSIGMFSFKDCTGITEITLPASLEKFDLTSFYACTSLENVYVDPNNPNFTSIKGVVYSKDKTKLLFCPPGKSGILRVPNTVTEISLGAFQNSPLTEIIIPDSVTVIKYDRDFILNTSTLIRCNKGTAAEKFALRYSYNYDKIVCTHEYLNEYFIDFSADCVNNGQISKHCEYCGAIDQSSIIEIKALGHKAGEEKIVKEPTCTEDGAIESTCTVCGEIASSEIIEHCHAHSLWTWLIKPADFAMGIKIRFCPECGEQIVKQSNELVNIGDINDDGSLNVLDLVRIKKLISNNSAVFKTADLDGNNRLDTSDMVLIRKYMIGNLRNFPVLLDE